MIETKTVFVLGAGAHVSYGYPSGDQLKSQVAMVLKNAQGALDEMDLQRLVPLGKTEGKVIGYESIKHIGLNLEASAHLSVDAYLNTNSHVEGAAVFGKAAIAQVLLGYENRGRVTSDDDWISYLMSEMVHGVKGAGVEAAKQFAEKNKVGFVTFNYDRHLEKTLLHKLLGSYTLSPKEAIAALRSVEICHVFGMLGDWPDEGRTNDWIAAVDRIQLIHEAKEANKEVAQARRMLREAHVICILGFGYHDENITLVELGAAIGNCKGYIATSRFGMTDGEWIRRRRRLPSERLHAAGPGDKCLAVLRNLGVFP